LMYYTGRDFRTGKRLFVEKTTAGRELQKKILVAKTLGFGYGGRIRQTPKREGKSWEKTRMSKRIPRKNLPKR